MDSNYFTSLYMAHATLSCWLRTSRKDTTSSGKNTPRPEPTTKAAPRHLIFTASIVALYSFAGYSPYAPCKAALRALSDNLSQEMNLYAAAHPTEPPVRLHTIFPGTILTESYEAENRIKPDLTKMLEEGDPGQTPEAIASKSIKALEHGEELITTDFSGYLLRCTMLGGMIRRGFWDWILAGVLAIVMIFIRGDFDRKVRKWGQNFGESGMKGDHQ